MKAVPARVSPPIHRLDEPATPAGIRSRVQPSLLQLWAWVVALALLAGVISPAGAASVYLQALNNGSPAGVGHSAAAAGADGSVYVTGNYWNLNGNDSGNLRIGNTTLVQSYPQTSASYVAKLGPDGGWRWALRLYSDADTGAFVSAITVSGNNVFIAGTAKQRVIIEDAITGHPGRQTITGGGSSSNRAPYIIKLTLDGKFVWGKMVKAFGYSPTFDGSVNAMAVDSAGSVVICGRSPFQNIPTNGVGPLPYSNSATQGWVLPGIVTPPLGAQGAYLAKIDGNGKWLWMTAYGGTEFANEFYGLTTDQLDRVYVTGWVSGNSGDVLFRTNGTTFASGIAAGGAENAMVARINPDGAWLERRYFYSPVASGKSRGAAVLFAKGKLYLAVEYTNTCYCVGDNTFYGTWDNGTDLALLKFTATLDAVEGYSLVKGANNEYAGANLGADGAGNIYFSGMFDQPQAKFGTNRFLTPPEDASVGPDVTTPKANFFVEKLNPALEVVWVQSAAGIPPDAWGYLKPVPPRIAVDRSSGTTYVLGSFSGGTLRLGADATATEFSWGDYATFVTALQSSGEFLQQVQLEVISEFGGNFVKPARGKLSYLRGQAISASVPPILYEDAQGNSISPDDNAGITERAVVRHTCLGYEVLDTAIAGSAASYGFNIDQDTTVRFLWKTEYALEVKNNLAGSEGGLTSTAAGNPEPVVQKHWIEEGTISTAFVDGLVISPNPNEFGTRYRTTGYLPTGSAVGILQPAMNFDGTNDHVDLGTLPAIAFSDGISLEAWVKYDRVSNWAGIFEASTPSKSDTIFLANPYLTRNLNFRIYQGNSSVVDLTANNVISPGNWQHLAVTVDPLGVATIYVNGVPMARSTNGPGRLPLTLARTRSYIGWGPASELAKFPGQMGEVRLWTHARSAEQIRGAMQVALAGTETGLAGYWRLTDAVPEGDPVTVFRTSDLSRNGIKGTLVDGDPSSLVFGTFTNYFPWVSLQARQQVPQFIMSRPGTIEYRWVKENRMQIATTPTALANVPTIVGGGQTNTGTGEFWYTNGTTLRLLTADKPASPSGYQSKGFTGGFGNVGTVTGSGGITNVVVGGVTNRYRFYDIAALNRGSSLIWDYSDRIYRGRVFIGDAVNFGGSNATFTGVESIPPDALINAESAPVGVTIVSNAPAGSSIDDMRVWDDFARKLYPLRPGVVLLEWPTLDGGPDARNVLTELTVEFPAAASFTHIANTPGVPLDSDTTNAVKFLSLKYSERSSAVVNDSAEFTVNDATVADPFRTVLLFSERPDGAVANGDLTRERLRVRTVQTRRWDNRLMTNSAVIGSPIVSSLHSNTVPHNGYVYWAGARYNPDIYNRSTRQGPIIPVNRFPTAKPDESLVVVWYQTVEGIHWPYQAVRYDAVWPSVQTADRIVIASRLGSEGFRSGGRFQPSFDTARYEQVKIYNQPSPTKAGYNPNEEHALLAPSLLYTVGGTPPPAAYALRNNLNITNADATYTSDPFVLVQYFDKQTTNYGMSAYFVQIQDPNFPARRLDFTAGLTNDGIYVIVRSNNVVEFNYPQYVNATGMITNEPVELEANDNLLGLSGGRYYLKAETADRFTLSAVRDGPPVTATGVTPAEFRRISVIRAFPHTFEYTMLAGQPVQAPYPLQSVIGAGACPGTSGENLDPSQLVYWEDHKKQPWAVSGSTNPAAGLRAQFYYPLAPTFWFAGRPVGECVPFVFDPAPVWVTNHVSWPVGVPTLKGGETLTFSGGELKRDDGSRPGLPGVLGWASGRVVFDDSNPTMDYGRTISNYLVRLSAPLLTLEVPLLTARFPTELLPAGRRVTVEGSTWSFNDLGASLNPRVFYNPVKQTLGIRGFVDGKTLGDPDLTAAPGSISILQPNILTPQDRAALKALSLSVDWNAAVDALYSLSRDPNKVAANFSGAAASVASYGVGLEVARQPDGTAIPARARPASQIGPGLALLPNQALLNPVPPLLKDGYVTLAENDDDLLGDAPVALHIIRVRRDPVLRGAIKTITPENAFDENITLRHSGEFGANASDLIFQWWYRPDDAATLPPDLLPDDKWRVFPADNQGLGAVEINLKGASAALLADNLFFVRWRYNATPTNWSAWAGAANSRPPNVALGERPSETYRPQLAEGWVKRVIAGINPFDARFSDFRNNNSPATYASMVQQAGAPYRGPVALNGDKDVIENTGLIELYSTVVRRASDLSINLSQPVQDAAVNNAILLGASRVADLYLMLGNEAYSDAQDPTIGFGSDSVEYGSLAPTVFAFQNQVPTLMDEELALLRGRSEFGAYPAWNRLLWNFTRAEGEAAYALSYGITDQNGDGFINETDGRISYPQGHGDAWGHYLSALRTYYDLLRHPYYDWQSRSEQLQIEGVVVQVDYLDERKFAQAAAARAKAGSEIVNLTYRSRYVEDPDGQWQGYADSDASRAWGVNEWARRAGTAVVYDWITANALLPATNAQKSGIERVDRTTVKEIAQISGHAVTIQKQFESANAGLNPVGLVADVVPFDIDPTGIDVGGGATHFEQVYDRAIKALQNALDLFDNANQLNNMLRQTAATADQFAADATAQDTDFRNRLIEIFGTPYEGTIGPGKAYPAGYQGPDIYLYMYVDVNSLEAVPAPSESFTAFFKQMDNGFVNTGAPGGGGNSIATAWGNYFKGDAPSLQNATNTDFSQVLSIKMPQSAKGYSFQAPAEWGRREAPGEIQQVLNELVQGEADLQLALADYDSLMAAIKDTVDLIRAQSDLAAEGIDIRNLARGETLALQGAILVADGVAAVMEEGAATAEDIGKAVAEAFPRSVGLASDVTAPARAAVMAAAVPAEKGFISASFVAERLAHSLESTKEIVAIQQEIDLAKGDYKYAIQEQLKELESQLGDEASKRIEVFRVQEALRAVSDKYRALLASGVRLMEEREQANKDLAGAVQQNRYQDFTFRVFRNEALSKYRAAFELAARYAYLAAKAYDYETNLDPTDAASARPLLTQIIRARTLGALVDGSPRIGSGGLADALAALKVNFDVLKSQMGFNNPQTESGRFSLRNELFRIAPGPTTNGVRNTSPTESVTYAGQSMTAEQAWAASDSKWRSALQDSTTGGSSAKVVPDVWQVPEFRRYCRPFAPESAGAQPALVITFGSQVVFGKNFFGWPLAGGDSSYDPSHFATKVRSVGMWFENYNGEGLSATPRAYLVPAGIDIMLVPSSVELASREWNVVDQKIPVPLPVGQASLRDPSWIPARDSLNGTMAEIRRYSMFRAYHDGGFSTDQMTSDSRLIGRSVWNTRWMLIIPGGTLLANGQEGLDTFIRGQLVPGGTGRDGNGITDIKLYFQTYSYSGN